MKSIPLVALLAAAAQVASAQPTTYTALSTLTDPADFAADILPSADEARVVFSV